MSAGGQDTGREMAVGLGQILAQALDDAGTPRTLQAARELAQMLSLRGLERLLAVFAGHDVRPWPAALRPAMQRVLATAVLCARDGNVDAFRHADDELALTARAVESVMRRPTSSGGTIGGGSAAVPGHLPGSGLRTSPVLLAEVLAGLKVQQGAELMSRLRVEPLHAAALRAALDWLLDDGDGTRRPLALNCDGSTLEVQCEGISFSGLEHAAEVLTGVGGRLGPGGDRPGAWSLCVAVAAERETFMMFEQDALSLAVPWSAVSRVRLLPVEAIQSMAQRQGLPVLPPLARDARPSAEQPVMIVALGLKRACLVADRLVWRMEADAVPAPGEPPAAGIERAVQTDDGDTYWVLEPAWLLRDVAAPPLPDAPRKRRAPAPVIARPEPQGSPPPIPFRRPAEFRELTADHVEPIAADPAAAPFVEPPAAATPATVAEAPAVAPVIEAPSTAPVVETPSVPLHVVVPAGPAQALIAEDSITARVFLKRLLEQRGFTVHAAATARELRELLPHGPWALVCADVELPDGRGPELLRETSLRLGGTGVLVALVRDAADELTARAAGVSNTLRKPFEGEALDRMLKRVAPTPGSAGTP